MSSFLLAQDALSGKEGVAYMTVGGRVVELFGMRKVNVEADIQTAKVKVVGARVEQNKTIGVAYGGAMSIYYGTPEFLNIAQRYAATGVMPYFNMVVKNTDPASTVGTQTVVIYNCQLTGKIPLAMLDGDAETLSMDSITFNATDVKVFDAFTAPTTLGAGGLLV